MYIKLIKEKIAKMALEYVTLALMAVGTITTLLLSFQFMKIMHRLLRSSIRSLAIRLLSKSNLILKDDPSSEEYKDILRRYNLTVINEIDDAPLRDPVVVDDRAYYADPNDNLEDQMYRKFVERLLEEAKSLDDTTGTESVNKYHTDIVDSMIERNKPGKVTSSKTSTKSSKPRIAGDLKRGRRNDVF